VNDAALDVLLAESRRLPTPKANVEVDIEHEALLGANRPALFVLLDQPRRFRPGVGSTGISPSLTSTLFQQNRPKADIGWIKIPRCSNPGRPMRKQDSEHFRSRPKDVPSAVTRAYERVRNAAGLPVGNLVQVGAEQRNIAV
jgi:hypothetical protein